MAIYHCSVRTFSRAQGHSAVAAAAYRAGTLLQDERTSKWHRYEKRKGVKDAFILAPPEAPEKYLNRAFLWNAAEASENRKNSRVAREVILALPHELSDKEREDLSRDMALYLIERYRVAVDVAIHAPTEGDGHDSRNHHAHLLFTTRELTNEGLGAKTRVLDDKTQGPQEIEIIREVWETLANEALKRAGFEDISIDRRTLEAQGVDRIPQTHVGPQARQASKEEPSQPKKKTEPDGKGMREKDEKSDDEEEEESEGKSSSGDSLPPKIDSKTKEDFSGRKIDYKVIDQDKTRSAFLEEIKALNEQRNQLGAVPIDRQIAEIEKLIDTLDGRIDRLGDLLKKTSLSDRVQKAIANLIHRSKEIILAKEQAKAERVLSRKEKRARAERQINRYGRIYRTGLHTQIKEMKQGLESLKTLKRSYTSIQRFVERIEKELKTAKPPSIALNREEQGDQRTITHQEAKLKLSLKADMLRSQIPDQFKAIRPESDSSFTPKGQIKEILARNTLGNIDTRRTEISTPPDSKASQLILRAEFATARGESPKPQTSSVTLRASFKQIQMSPKTASYRQPMPVKFRAMEEALKARPPIKVPDKYEALKVKPVSQRPWFTPANEKTKPLQNALHQKMADVPKTTSRPAEPVKRTSNRQSSERIRHEAQTKRAKVPPQHRAKTYEERAEKHPGKVHFNDLERERAKREADRKGESLRSKFKTKARQEQSARPEPKTVKNEDVINNMKEKARAARENVPPQYRAKPYESVSKAAKSVSDNIKSAAGKAKETILNVFKRTQAPPKEKMSNGFNAASGFNASAQPEADMKSGMDFEKD